MKKFIVGLLLGLLFVFSYPTENSEASTLYRLEIGDFLGEDNVKNSLQRLKSDTGWWATYEPTKQDKYYKIVSGNYYGESNVTNTLNEFKQVTGLNATYHPVGEKIPYQRIFSGSYYGEETVQKIVQEFTNETGISASYIQNQRPVTKKRIFSGAYYGESNVQKIVEEFKNTTGISATYEPTGSYTENMKVVSGGFLGEENVKNILASFQNSTGINASYEPITFVEGYKIVTGGIYGESNVQAIIQEISALYGVSASYEPLNQPNIYRVVFPELSGNLLTNIESYLKEKNWWYSKEPTGNKIPTHFRIVTDELTTQSDVQKALQFFENNNWWATSSKTGNKTYSYFNIITEAILFTEDYNKALQFFTDRNFWAVQQNTNEIGYPYFDIVTEETVDKELLNKAKSFFEKRGYWYRTENTGRYKADFYRIETDNLLGEANRNKALQFFNDRNLWAEANVSGDANYYKIVTGAFINYEAAVNAKERVTNNYGWWTTVVEVKPPKSKNVRVKNYIMTFDSFLDIQSSNSPKLDGAAIFTASRLLVAYHSNPNNFSKDSHEYYQFLDLTSTINLTPAQINALNDYLKGMGKLEGTAAAFNKAGVENSINPIYLIAHAIHETGRGTSTLSKGVVVNGRTVYNMFGYAAYDSNPVGGGSQYAYNQGWFTPEAAILGGAKNIKKNYIYRSGNPQNTLYKMKWNPEKPGVHQYATHVAWATAMTKYMHDMYELLGTYNLTFEVPSFQNQPASSPEPSGEARYAILSVPDNFYGYTTATSLNVRNYPKGTIIGAFPYNTQVKIIGHNGGWYKVIGNGITGWVSGDYVKTKNALQVTASKLNVRSTPNGPVIGALNGNDIVIGVVDANDNFVKSGIWIKIIYNGREAWVSSNYVKEL